MLESTTQNFNVRNVLADKAYSGYANMDFAAEKAVTPFVMFRDNATTNTEGGV